MVGHDAEKTEGAFSLPTMLSTTGLHITLLGFTSAQKDDFRNILDDAEIYVHYK